MLPFLDAVFACLCTRVCVLGPGGSAMWNQGAKTLTLFAVKDVEGTVGIQFSFTLEVHVYVSLCLVYMCIFCVSVSLYTMSAQSRFGNSHTTTREMPAN